jgi:hypothetical protein
VAHVVRGAARDTASGEGLPLSVAAMPGTALQRGVMAACVIWGFVGTALYFRRRTA